MPPAPSASAPVGSSPHGAGERAGRGPRAGTRRRSPTRAACGSGSPPRGPRAPPCARARLRRRPPAERARAHSGLDAAEHRTRGESPPILPLCDGGRPRGETSASGPPRASAAGLRLEERCACAGAHGPAARSSLAREERSRLEGRRPPLPVSVAARAAAARERGAARRRRRPHPPGASPRAPRAGAAARPPALRRAARAPPARSPLRSPDEAAFAPQRLRTRRRRQRGLLGARGSRARSPPVRRGG
jgi:hypothetical protein